MQQFIVCKAIPDERRNMQEKIIWETTEYIIDTGRCFHILRNTIIVDCLPYVFNHKEWAKDFDGFQQIWPEIIMETPPHAVDSVPEEKKHKYK